MRCKLLVSAILVSSILSCSPDCKEVTLKKPVWKTHYEEYWVKRDTIQKKVVTIDTLVPYSMVKHQTEKSYLKNYHDEVYDTKVTHYITIQNNSDKYSNSFAIRMTGKEYSESSKKWNDFNRSTDNVTISPNSSHTFSLRHSDRWRTEDSTTDEGNVQIFIVQKPTQISLTRQIATTYNKKCIRRIDELTFTDTIVNNCECDVDALKAEYKAIQNTYERLKKEKLIRE